jgi:predicted HicB family RNase H-like nuclease
MAKRTQHRIPESRDARINIRARPALRAALVELARRDGRSLSSYVERVLDEHVRSRAERRG